MSEKSSKSANVRKITICLFCFNCHLFIGFHYCPFFLVTASFKVPCCSSVDAFAFFEERCLVDGRQDYLAQFQQYQQLNEQYEYDFDEGGMQETDESGQYEETTEYDAETRYDIQTSAEYLELTRQYSKTDTKGLTRNKPEIVDYLKQYRQYQSQYNEEDDVYNETESNEYYDDSEDTNSQERIEIPSAAITPTQPVKPPTIMSQSAPTIPRRPFMTAKPTQSVQPPARPLRSSLPLTSLHTSAPSSIPASPAPTSPAPTLPSPSSPPSSSPDSKPLSVILLPIRTLSEQERNHPQIVSNGEGISFLAHALKNSHIEEDQAIILEILANLSKNEEVCSLLVRADVMQAVMGFLESPKEDLSGAASVIMKNIDHKFKNRHRTPSAAQRSLLESRELKACGTWTPDNSADACMLCSKRFNAVYRRHHCRLCGGLYCGTCTATRLLIEVTPKKWSKERVCTKCVELYAQGPSTAK